MKTPKTKASKDPNKLRADGNETDRDKLLAKIAFDGTVSNAATARLFAKGSFGELDLTECVSVLSNGVKQVQDGDLKSAEELLMAQAATLNAIFNETARRAALNMGEHLPAMETYLRLALKAQSQCRSTLETLATIKNPPVVFAKQANVTTGPQQINNGIPPPARGIKTEPNELLEVEHGQRLDTRATRKTGRADPAMATLEPIHRTTDG